MVYIYVLKLQYNKYYVGKTSNPQFRIDSHFNNDGSEWTKKYKAVSVVELISNCDDYDEDKYTMIYMDKYGVDNVRGGSYTSVSLDQNTLSHIEKIRKSTQDKCFKCGKSGHFANTCYVTKKASSTDTKKKKICGICGKSGHYEVNCYEF